MRGHKHHELASPSPEWRSDIPFNLYFWLRQNVVLGMERAPALQSERTPMVRWSGSAHCGSGAQLKRTPGRRRH
jgi:hypothetical protein